MAKIKLEDYTVSIDQYNASVHHNYVGEYKDGSPKQSQRLVGHYNPRVATGCVQAIEGIVKDALSREGDMDLEEFKEFCTLNKEDIQKWVEEQWNRK